MARSLTAGMITELTADVLSPVLLAKLEFDSGDVRVWSGIGDLTFNAEVYTGLGDLGGISSVTETQLLKSSGVTLSLSGIPQTQLSIALTEDYSERPASIWVGALDSAGALVADPDKLFAGRMDVMEIDEGAAEAVIGLSIENRLADLERDKGRSYTPEDQKKEYPGDQFFDFVPSLSDGKQIIWGSG